MKKQPDKITAYYYRAANKQTDPNLDQQMAPTFEPCAGKQIGTICSSWTMGTAA